MSAPRNYFNTITKKGRQPTTVVFNKINTVQANNLKNDFIELFREKAISENIITAIESQALDNSEICDDESYKLFVCTLLQTYAENGSTAEIPDESKEYTFTVLIGNDEQRHIEHVVGVHGQQDVESIQSVMSQDIDPVLPLNELEFTFGDIHSFVIERCKTVKRFCRFYATAFYQYSLANNLEFSWGKKNGIPRHFSYLGFDFADAIDNAYLTSEQRCAIEEAKTYAIDHANNPEQRTTVFRYYDVAAGRMKRRQHG